MIPTKEQLLKARAIVEPYTHATPVLTSQLLNDMVGAEVYFKCENFQKMGAFKMRGAVHKIMNLTKEQRSRGVVTHSSGNFGQAVALSAKNLGVKAYVVMPSNAPQVKKDAVRSYGGVITECEATIAARERETQRIEEETGATFMHPSNDMDVILGNSTAAAELLEAESDLDYIFSPIGGGGLIAGTALAAHHFGNQCKTIGGEPMEADDAYRSLLSGMIETNQTAHTIADGLRTYLGDQNFPIIQQLVTQIIRVEEQEIIEAMQLIWERMKIIIEPSSAVAFAAVLKNKEQFLGKSIGLIVSGGNIDVRNLPF
ncbi:MAG: threonine/serine dehydratase [Flavobacteriaceae bacterium]